MKKWIPYLGFLALALGVGMLSGKLSADGLERTRPLLEKIPLNPPSIVFPIVWTILYLLMGISAARVFLKKDTLVGNPALLLWQIQLAVNFCWSLLFFELNFFFLSFLWLLLLWVLVLGFILLAKRLDTIAAWLQIPYLLWLTFAAYLNFAAWWIAR